MKHTQRILTICLICALLFSFVSCGALPDAGGSFSPGFDDGGAMSPDNSDPSDQWEGEGIPPANANGIVENPFINTQETPTSTFSADVDTASYTFFRSLVKSGSYTSISHLQLSGVVFRTEEFLNYFRYDVKTPEAGELFSVTSSVTAAPWNPQNGLLHLTLQSESVPQSQGNNFVFLIDVSGSMSSPQKLPLLQEAFGYLIANLSANDTISIVTYAGREEVVLDGAKGDAASAIRSAIDKLYANGSTNGEAGLKKAYQLAEKHFIEGGNNRIILASDGDLNVGMSDIDTIRDFVSQKKESGVYLSVLGFGGSNYRDDMMETIADHGNGAYYYIDGITEAEKVFSRELTSTLYTVADDVKLQLSFSPSVVASYRLIGYENRVMDNEDFDNDKKDAGEVGAGHQVTVLYEFTWQESPDLFTDPGASVATLAVRHKKPGEHQSHLQTYTLSTGDKAHTDGDLAFMDNVVMLCMLLRESRFLPQDGSVTLYAILASLRGLSTNDPYQATLRAELVTLIEAILPQNTETLRSHP